MTRLLLLAMLVSTNAQAGEVWDSLWHNADQRGERLLQQGKAAEAAKTYSDVRHKAYAQLQAGDFQNSAKNFASLNDSNANYNRGTALAHAGKLEESLKAFDAALAQAPQDKDAQRNRALVNKALQQQPKQKPPSSKDSSSDSKKPKDQPDSSSKSGGKDSEKKDNGDKKPSDKNDKTQQSKDGSGGDNKSTGNQAQPKLSASSPAEEQAKSDDAAQAKRDAAAALGKPGVNKSALAAPVTETKLAQEQWLRRIPDDPGGLLRRKFMIEHMIRQQGKQQ